MKIFHRDEWINDSELKKFRFIPATFDKHCDCDEQSDDVVELIDHDSCIRGRIDSIVCVKCNVVKSFSIIR